MKIRSGVGYDITNNFCGLDVTVPFEVLSQKFKKMVRHVNSAQNKDLILSVHSSLCSHLPGPWYGRGRTERISSSKKDKGGRPRDNVAELHMIMKLTSVCDGVKMLHIVACQNHSDLKPATLEKMVNNTLMALHDCGFAVCVLVGDGAGENVKLFKSLSTIPISKFLPEDLQKRFPRPIMTCVL
jgi:hypothetical protein